MNESPAASHDPSPEDQPAKSGAPDYSCPLVRRGKTVFLTLEAINSVEWRSLSL